MEIEEKNDNGEEVISKPIEDGGEIGGKLDAYENPIEGHKATTTRWIAYLLIGIFGVSFVIHYVVMICLAFSNKTDAMEIAERTFSTWLPIISGFVGAAVAYFFTRERNGKK